MRYLAGSDWPRGVYTQDVKPDTLEEDQQEEGAEGAPEIQATNTKVSPAAEMKQGNISCTRV
jgi:hypothetical protein